MQHTMSPVRAPDAAHGWGVQPPGSRDPEEVLTMVPQQISDGSVKHKWEAGCGKFVFVSRTE